MGRSVMIWQRLQLVLTGLIAVALLNGCAPIMLVPPYDEQIDNGLTTLYSDTTAFVDRMISLRGTPEGSYAKNSDFYEAATAKVGALVVRAEAHRVLNDCPSSALVSRAFALARIPEDVRGTIGTLPRDDCQVVLLRLIQDGYGNMAKVHQIQGDAGLPPMAHGQFIDGGVGAQLRAAITVEIAKRAR